MPKNVPPSPAAAAPDETATGVPASSSASNSEATRSDGFAGLTGAAGVAAVLVVVAALGGDLSRLVLPTAGRRLLEAGPVVVALGFVMLGFRLGGPLVGLLGGAPVDPAGEVGGRPASWARDARRPVRIARAGLFRVLPLHLAAVLLVVLALDPASEPWAPTLTGLVTGSSGVLGPGYPLSWVVPVATVTTLLLILSVSLIPLRPSGRGLRRAPVHRPGPPVTGLAVVVGAAGVVLLGHAPVTGLALGVSAEARWGQALLGLAAGIMTYRVLERSTGSLRPPLPGTRPARRTGTGMSTALSLAAVCFCVYRADLMIALHLLPVFPAAAGLVYCVTRPDLAPVAARVLHHPVVRRLGSRALALVLLHGPLLLLAHRGAGAVDPGRTSTSVTLAVVLVTLGGSVAAAELAHRRLPLATPHRPELTQPTGPTPHRSGRLQPVDLDSIPAELRLLALPRPVGEREISSP